MFITDHSWLQVDKHGPGNVFASAGLREEGGEGVVPERLVRRHVSVRLDAMFQAVELPAGVADLAAGLADVDGDTLALKITRSFSIIYTF